MKIKFLAFVAVFSLFAVSAQAYTIKSGDTLTKIANKYNTTVKQLVADNNIQNPNLIYTGANLIIGGSDGNLAIGGAPTTTGIRWAQTQYFTLSGAGASLGATSITLASFTQIDGTLLTMSNFGAKGFGTIEPNNGTKEEQIVFTGVTQNANGTATLTGVSRVSNVYPYTETSATAKTHTGGTKFVLSNTAGFYNTFANRYNDEDINGIWTFNADPKSSSTIQTYIADGYYATQGYVNNVGAGGFTASNASTTQGIKVFSTSPETIGVNVSTTKGMTIGIDGAIYQKASSTVGILQDSNGMYLDSSYVVLDSDTTSTPTASKIPIADANKHLSIGWIATSTVNGDFLRSTSTGAYWGAIGTTGTLLDRLLGVTYYNSSTVALFVNVSVRVRGTNSYTSYCDFFVSGTSTPSIKVSTIGNDYSMSGSSTSTYSTSFIVPSHYFYRTAGSGSGAEIVNWYEMQL